MSEGVGTKAELSECMKRWNKRTAKAEKQWPLRGTFDVELCHMIREIEEKQLTRTSAQEKKLRRLAILQAFENHAVILREKEKGYQQGLMTNKTEDTKESSEEKTKEKLTENSQTDNDRPPAYAPDATNIGMYPSLIKEGWQSAEINMTGGIKFHSTEPLSAPGESLPPKETTGFEFIQTRPSNLHTQSANSNVREAAGPPVASPQQHYTHKEQINPLMTDFMPRQLTIAEPVATAHHSYTQPITWEEGAQHETERFSIPVRANYERVDGILRRVEGELRIETEGHARLRQQEIMKELEKLATERLPAEATTHTLRDPMTQLDRHEPEKQKAEWGQKEMEDLAEEVEKLKKKEKARQQLAAYNRELREKRAEEKSKRQAEDLITWEEISRGRSVERLPTVKTRTRSNSVEWVPTLKAGADHSPADFEHHSSAEFEDSGEESEDESGKGRKGRAHVRRSKRLQEKQTAKQFPLLYKGLRTSYVPWSFMDLKGLTEQLPSINSGGQRWVTAFEERTAGHKLAIGDIKAILSQTVGKVKMENILSEAGMQRMADTQRITHLTPHEMLTGRPMPVTYLRGPTRGPNLEQLQKELQEYVKCLTKIHKEIFTQVKGATEGRTSTIDDERLKEVLPGDYVYIKTFKRGWSEPRREGPFEVVLATPTAVKVKGRKVWIHLNHCSRAPDLLRPVTSEGPDQQPPHAAADGEARDQPAAGPSRISRPVTRSITRATPPDDEDSD
ncbi:hypothetical protein SRHO_G00066660 [Serrasalmus rhombeus]